MACSGASGARSRPTAGLKGPIRASGNTTCAMPRRIRTARRTDEQIEADVAADALATTLGDALEEARKAAGLTQAEVGRRSGLAQTSISLLERGEASGVSLRTWVRAASVIGVTVKAYLAGVSSAGRPMDAVHLRTQELIARTGLEGGWASMPELAIDDAARGSRSLDLWLERRAMDGGIEVIAFEVMDWFEDVGARFRDWDRRIERVRQLAAGTRSVEGPDGLRLPIVAGCWVVRDTRRNRELLRDHATLFAARFPGSGRALLDALTSGTPLVPECSLVWVNVAGDRLTASASASRRARPRRG